MWSTGGEGFASARGWRDLQDSSHDEDVGDDHSQESEHGNNARED